MEQKLIFTIFAITFLTVCVSAEDDDIYDGCGTTKQCLGYPGDCVPDKDCVTMSSSFVRGE